MEIIIGFFGAVLAIIVTVGAAVFGFCLLALPILLPLALAVWCCRTLSRQQK
jgi:Sec-independent protein secretion pathway component TatC